LEKQIIEGLNLAIIRFCVYNDTGMRGIKMEYMSTRQASIKWKISERRVQFLCAEGKVDGAKRLGWMWLIPDYAQKPEDARKKQKNTDSY